MSLDQPFAEMMNDAPYTTPDEDPFNIQPLPPQPRRRRSSLLNKWIQEQQKQPTTESNPAPSNINSFLVYPELVIDRNATRDDVSTLNSYDLVDDDDIPQNAHRKLEPAPSTPTTARSHRTSKLLQTPSSFRSFNISFRSSSPASQLPDSSSPRPSRFSFLPRTGSTSHQQHIRSSSLSTLNVTGNSPTPIDIVPASPSSRWRPSVLGHFSAAAISQTSVVPSDTAYTPSRPSVSSSNTYTSATATATESDLPMTPSKMNFMDSIRSRSGSHSIFRSGSRVASSSSVWSHKPESVIGFQSTPTLSIAGSAPLASGSSSTPSHEPPTTRIPLAPKPKSRLANSNISHGDDDEDDENDVTFHAAAPPIKRDPSRPHVAYSTGGTLPRVKFSSLSTRHRKRKKLVVSGVGPNEFRKFEGVKRWCESFGEVSQIMRMPNGDLHVHFRLAEVADTVCRLRAKVYIAGVGSVQLSWFTGDKR